MEVGPSGVQLFLMKNLLQLMVDELERYPGKRKALDKLKDFARELQLLELVQVGGWEGGWTSCLWCAAAAWGVQWQGLLRLGIHMCYVPKPQLCPAEGCNCHGYVPEVSLTYVLLLAAFKHSSMLSSQPHCV